MNQVMQFLLVAFVLLAVFFAISREPPAPPGPWDE